MGSSAIGIGADHSSCSARRAHQDAGTIAGYAGSFAMAATAMMATAAHALASTVIVGAPSMMIVATQSFEFEDQGRGGGRGAHRPKRNGPVHSQLSILAHGRWYRPMFIFPIVQWEKDSTLHMGGGSTHK